MDTNHGAAGDPPDDDVFGPVEDGEEVFEWIDDQDGGDEPGEQAVRPPPRTLRERMATVRSAAGACAARAARSRRRPRRSSWPARSAVRAPPGSTTSPARRTARRSSRCSVDSVVDGDPAASSYNADGTTATGQYVVEVANNSPDAVTLDSVGVDAGP